MQKNEQKHPDRKRDKKKTKKKTNLLSHRQCEIVNGLKLKYPNFLLNAPMLARQWSWALQHLSSCMSVPSSLYRSANCPAPHHFVPGTMKFSLNDRRDLPFLSMVKIKKRRESKFTKALVFRLGCDFKFNA